MDPAVTDPDSAPAPAPPEKPEALAPELLVVSAGTNELGRALQATSARAAQQTGDPNKRRQLMHSNPITFCSPRDDLSLTPPRLMAWLRSGRQGCSTEPGGAAPLPPSPQRVCNLGRSGVLAEEVEWGRETGDSRVVLWVCTAGEAALARMPWQRVSTGRHLFPLRHHDPRVLQPSGRWRRMRRPAKSRKYLLCHRRSRSRIRPLPDCRLFCSRAMGEAGRHRVHQSTLATKPVLPGPLGQGSDPLRGSGGAAPLPPALSSTPDAGTEPRHEAWRSEAQVIPSIHIINQ
jgi:hypothetical protein